MTYQFSSHAISVHFIGFLFILSNPIERVLVGAQSMHLWRLTLTGRTLLADWDPRRLLPLIAGRTLTYMGLTFFT